MPQDTFHGHDARHAVSGLAVALVVLVAMVGAASAQQTWNLSITQSGSNYIMYSGSQGEDENPVTIGPGNSAIWISNETAGHYITFPEGDWTFYWTGNQTSSENGTAEIGFYTGSSFNPFGEVPITDDGSFTISATSFIIPQGKWLALQITNADNTNPLYIQTEESYVTSPDSSPDFPYPELSAVVLFCTGLIALVGYVGYRKRT